MQTANDRSSDCPLHSKNRTRKVRGLRHRGDFLQTRISMKSFFHIANPTALRPYGHGPAACGLKCAERARKGFFLYD